MKRWEWAFPITAAVLVGWATIPDMAHFCGFWEWSRFCGMGWIFRLDILLPIVAVLAIWGWTRTFLLWKYTRDLAVIVQDLIHEWEASK